MQEGESLSDFRKRVGRHPVEGELPELIWNDPESEACFTALSEVIAEELDARIAVHDTFETPEDVARIAELVADGVLEGFSIRERPADKPRTSWGALQPRA
jgi:hypothetical protein